MRKLLTPEKVVISAFLISLTLWAFRFIGKLPAVTDEILFSYPSQAVNLSQWKQGFLPLWDPFTGCGMPQLANDLSACLYPPFWFFNLTGLSHWLVWMSLLHTALAFVGFYLWGRSQKISGAWAALAAVSFAGSLHLTRIWAYPMFSAAQAWTPWVFYMAAKFLEKGRRRWWLGLVFTIAMQLLAGYPFFSFYTLLFFLAWVFGRGRWDSRKGGVVGGIVTAFALSAAQLLPFLDYLGYSVRGGWGSPEKFPYFSRAAELFTLFSPTALGLPGTTTYQGQEANACFMMYFGLIPLAAWALGFFMPRTFSPRFWTWSSLFWLLWMMGGSFPLFRLIPEGALETVNPSKAIGVFLLAALTGAASGLSRYFQSHTQARWMGPLRWGIALIWMVDLLAVPWRTVFPVRDPFLEPNLVSQSHQILEAAQGQRVVSLHMKKKMLVEGGGGESFQGAADLWAGSLLANANEVWGLRASHAYVSTWTKGMDTFWKAFNQSANYDSRLPDLAGVKALDLPVELNSKHYSLLGKRGNDLLMVNQHCLPDFWIAGNEKEFPDTPSLLVQLLKEKSESTDSGSAGPQHITTAYLVKDAWLPAPQRNLSILESSLPLGWERPSATRAAFKGDFAVNTRTGNDAWLIWNEAFTPGWKAWLDGSPVSIVKAFGFFMAVAVPNNGQHEILFRFEPVSVRLGFFFTFLSWIGLIACFGRKK